MKRFSLRTLLLMPVLIAALVAWPLFRARQQQQAREWVAAQKGHSLFRYGYGTESQWYETESELMVPEAFVRWFGIDAFNPVESVVFDCTELQELGPLARMRSVRNIHVNIEISGDLDFTPLANLPNLESIYFTRWSFITETQLAKLRVLLPRVKIVSETYPQVVQNRGQGF